jgi:plastocyanin
VTRLKDEAMMSVLRVSVSKASVVAIAASAAALPLGAAAEARDYQVAMANMAYGPIPSGLKVGDSITWVNKDSVPHTVTARDHSFDLRIGPPQQGRVTLTKAGTYQIYCIIHSPMRTSLTVGS